MARPRKIHEGEFSIEILRDGVWVADNVRADKGEVMNVPSDIAEVLRNHGLAR